MSQLDHYNRSRNKVADVNNLFVYFVDNGLTATQLKKLINRRPILWGRFENWLKILPKDRTTGNEPIE